MMRPSDAKAVDVADVYKGDRIAGSLLRRPDGTEFQYKAGYVSEGGSPVASTLRLTTQPFRARSGAVPPFFAGLLPEGARLQALTTVVKTSADDELSLLVAVGSDTVGDVRVVPEGVIPAEKAPDLPSDVSQIRFAELLQASFDPQSDTIDRAVPGVQDKISDSMIAFPLKHAAGPSILKLEPVRYPLIARNEHFFLGLARLSGFAVPAHALVTDAVGEVGLLIARFDRVIDDGDMVRVAQEDGCQLLGRYPADKYRITVNELMDAVASTASASMAAALDLVLLYAFSWMLGNGDLHAKNYSLQWRDDGTFIVPTPAYDLVSTLAYPLDQHMAMRLDGRDSNFRAKYLCDFAERWGVPRRLTRRKLREVADRAEPGLEQIESIGFEADLTARMKVEILGRLNSLRAATE